MQSKTILKRMAIIFSIFLCASLFLIGACSKQTAQRAGQGAATGAVVGAVGGMVSAMVFGGNVGDAAARGAVWGGSTGAAAGAMSGAMAESNQKKTEQAAELEKLRQQLGDDAFNGLAALAECKHEVALGYGSTAAKSGNPDHALAGLWLQVLAYADGRQEDQARALFPELMVKDEQIASEAQAESELQNALERLKQIRQEHNLPQACG